MFTGIVVPTSTVASIYTLVGDQLTDPGSLAIIVLAIGLPLFFWAVLRIKGLFPKGR